MRIESMTAHPLPLQKAEPRLEQAFLEEMVKYILPKNDSGFSGGVGEDQFSFLVQREYATSLAKRFDLGLNDGK